ncbi:MAG: RnfABCDGE type electron transport complex subunit B [Deltaproteobacteria bacterium]|nr:RnfABCDGE type electron transport complex subunit B [Deltaproteobacteria bacterium]MBN2670906.1 RnfABCDGE type electron transport complex subunit B [Deltaproteobacteria bacterium]
MVTALSVLCGVGLVMAVLLAVGRKAFAVEVDKKLELLMKIMPGANCGGCGFPGCSGYARALADGKAEPTACPPGGPTLAEEIGKILGIEVEASEPMVALVSCAGGNDASPKRSQYSGIEDCKAAHAIAGGPKSCVYGCMGLGSCIHVCSFGAIYKTANGLVRVDPEKCTGCKKCVETCPRNIIKMVPKKADVHVLCNNPQKAKEVKAVCSVGCTGCKLCVKQSKAIEVTDALAVVNYRADTKISDTAALACPQNAIFDSRQYSITDWLENPATKEAFKKRAADWKAEEKKRKAEAKAKAGAKKDAAEKKEAANGDKEGDA